MSEQPEGVEHAPAAEVESERAVLGLCMQSAPSVRVAGQLLRVDDFYQPRHGLIFAALCDLVEQGTAPDPMQLMLALRGEGLLDRVGGAEYLHQLYAVPVAASSLAVYARRVRHASRVRVAQQSAARVLQAADQLGADEDRFFDVLAQEQMQLQLLVDAPADDAPIEGLSTWDEFWAEPDTPADWVVPGLLEREDVFMLLATEGGGKSWLTRQLCLAVAAGVHPFRPDTRIIAQNTLLVDLENAPSMVRRQSRPLGYQVAALGRPLENRAHIWRKQDGLNLRDRADVYQLERVIAETQPALVGFGSLYKAFKRGRDDWDTAADDVREVIDKLRRRYRSAFVIEHHMPKGDGKERPNTPYGSSVWMRWASHGRVLRQVGELNCWELTDDFRGDRDPRDWPAGLARGGELPWTPIWTRDDIDAMRETADQGPATRRGRR